MHFIWVERKFTYFLMVSINNTDITWLKFKQSESKILKGKDINHSHFILLDHKMIEKQTITNRLVNRIANLKLNEKS